MKKSPSKLRSIVQSVKSSYSFSMNIWKNYRWELFLVASIIVIFICWIIKNKNEKGSKSDIDSIYVPPSSIQKPKKTYKNEDKCREILQNIYGRKFDKVRPHFLKNHKTGKNLELDMYNDDLKLALEYNGIQHRVYVPHFHKSPKDYQNQVERDMLKLQKCRENGITLIVVPDTVRYNELENHIRSELRKCGRL